MSSLIVDSLPNQQNQLASAWARWNSTTTINDSYNVDSVTDLGTGHWEINFTNDLANSNYVSITGFGSTASGGESHKDTTTASVSSVRVQMTNSSGTAVDRGENSVVIFGGSA